MSSGVSRTLTTAGKCGISPTAAALAVNVTVTGATGPGHLTLHPADQPTPLVSTINFQAGQTRANNAILRVAADGDGPITIHPVVAGPGTVHVIVDVSGYFE